MNLVIVESPAKGKTIEKYLGKDYTVLASYGHVRDLPERKLGVDIEHDFEPEYRIIPRAKKTISALKSALAKADRVYLATDFDREGEAIAWHLMHALDLDKGKKPAERITFHEITKDAITEAIQHPRPLDQHLVDAQQARRVLDRLVGYKLSPFLWKKVLKGLSAGRVQSVAVRIIVDREREIQAFTPEEYWTIEAEFQKPGAGESVFGAQLVSKNGVKLEQFTLKSETDSENIRSILEHATYTVASVTTRDEERRPQAPFTTSTLQQEASRRLGFSAKKTMKVAQDLYEDGKITYMRTDSTNLAGVAIGAARQLIETRYGAKYLPDSPRVYKTRAKGAQEAHEAIRPTEVGLTPESLTAPSDDHARLYDLIWRRMVACQMNPAILAVTSIDLTGTHAGVAYGFRASGTMIKFDGFFTVWPSKLEERSLPTLVANDAVSFVSATGTQHFTEPPARFSEASLIKALEEHGIGRPSTYAPTMATILDRGYVRLDKRVFHPEEIGMVVTDLLKEHFPEIVDINFTAKMEEDFDAIAEGETQWVGVIRDFYGPFAKNLEGKLETVEKKELVHETTDEVCDKCGKPMAVKMGRFGKFLACTGFPDCKNAKPYIISTGVKCPICTEGELVQRQTRRRKIFWSCSRYPDCKAATWDLAKPATLPDPNRVPRWKKNQDAKAATTKKKPVAKKKSATKKTVSKTEVVAE